MTIMVITADFLSKQHSMGGDIDGASNKQTGSLATETEEAGPMRDLHEASKKGSLILRVSFKGALEEGAN